MRELMTIQLGSYANYVGTHWLNIQEAGQSYNPLFVTDVDSRLSFREGVTAFDEPTYTPRLLLVDLEGKLGYLPESGGIYPMAGDTDGDSCLDTVEVKPQYEKNPFIADMEKLVMAKKQGNIGFSHILKSRYDLTDNVHNWSDFLVQRLHPISISTIPCQHQVDETPFKCYENGVELWRNTNFSEPLIDKLQWYLEECDSLQGFQIISDVSDGFSGITVGLHEFMADEFHKKEKFSCIPFFDNDTQETKINFESINTGYALGHLAEYSDIILPMSTHTELFNHCPTQPLQHISLSKRCKYQHSAVLAAALDAISLPFRMRDNFTMSDFSTKMCIAGRKMCSASVSLPFPLQGSNYLLPLLEKWEEPLLTSLTPYMHYVMTDNQVQYVNVRGIRNTQLIPDCGTVDYKNPTYSCTRADEMLSLYCKFMSGGTVTYSASTEDTLRIPCTFPQILCGDYDLVEQDPERLIGRLSEYQMLAGIHNSYTMKSFVDSVRGHCSQKKIKHVQPHIESQELALSLEKLALFGELYVENWDL